MSRDKPPVSENVQRAVVREIAYLGDLSLYRVQLDTGMLLRVTQPNASGPVDARIGRDEAVWLTWDPAGPVVLTS
jgi:putrescine transport system ATP-binding protein